MAVDGTRPRNAAREGAFDGASRRSPACIALLQLERNSSRGRRCARLRAVSLSWRPMTLELDMETRFALVDQIKGRIPEREQKRVAHAIAKALKIKRTTAVPRLSRLLSKHIEVVDTWLGK